MTSPAQESVLSLVTELLRRRRIVALTTVTTLILVVVAGLLMTQFQSRARVLVQQDAGAAPSFAGLAAQIGLPVGIGGSENSPTFFAELLRSRDVLDSLAYSAFVADSQPAKPLLDLLEVEEDGDRGKRGLRAVKELRKRVSVSTDLASGLITVQVTMPTRQLAEDALERLLGIAERLNRRRQQASFAAERQFAETQLGNATAELRASEKKLESFLETNRTFAGSASLELQAATLRREVELRQAVTLGLAQAYERAKLEEVRNTPVLTLVESPGGSAEKTLKPPFLLVLGVVLGVVLGSLLAMWSYIRSVLASSMPNAYESVRMELKSTIRHPLSRS